MQTVGGWLSFTHNLDDLALKLPRIHVKGVIDIMENILSSNFERKLSKSSVDWKGDLYKVDKITDFSLDCISNIKYLFNLKMLRTPNGRQLL